MGRLTRDDLYSLEKYAAIRSDFRAKVMEHKKHRRVAISGHAALYFEDGIARTCRLYSFHQFLRS